MVWVGKFHSPVLCFLCRVEKEGKTHWSGIMKIKDLSICGILALTYHSQLQPFSGSPWAHLQVPPGSAESLYRYVGGHRRLLEVVGRRMGDILLLCSKLSRPAKLFAKPPCCSLLISQHSRMSRPPAIYFCKKVRKVTVHFATWQGTAGSPPKANFRKHQQPVCPQSWFRAFTCNSRCKHKHT